MSEEYPVLDNSTMSTLVEEFERQQALPSLENDPSLPPIPLPPEALHEVPEFAIPTEELPSFFEGDLPLLEQELVKETLHEKELPEHKVPVEVLQANKKANPMVEIVEKKDDVEGLALIENVFDKRITDKDIQQEINKDTRNDSGRLLDKKDVEVKTELNDAEIVNISKLRFIADRYHVPVLKDFTDNLMTLKISRNRKGRTEFIQGLHADERREQPEQGFFSKIFGGKG